MAAVTYSIGRWVPAGVAGAPNAHLSASIAHDAPFTARSLMHAQPSPLLASQARRPSVMMAAAQAPADAIQRQPSAAVLATLRGAEAVCFDVDSTFCQDESIDELAAFLGVGDAVAALTARAMGGTVLFQDALAQRLAVMKPSSADIDRYLASHPPLITPGIPELLALLQSQGKMVFLVSGGFRQIIHPLAQGLGIPLDHVFANNILFSDGDGAYAGFDPQEFTSRSGGKCEAVVHIKQRWQLGGVVMVGDGATDAEARQPGGADIFIGYGGVVFRQAVAEKADWYVMDVDEIRQALET